MNENWSRTIATLLGVGGVVLYLHGYVYLKSYLFGFGVSFFVAMPVELAWRTALVGYLSPPWLILQLVVVVSVVLIFLKPWGALDLKDRLVLIVFIVLLTAFLLVCSAIVRAKEDRAAFASYLKQPPKQTDSSAAELHAGLPKPHFGHCTLFLKGSATPELPSTMKGFLLAESDHFLTIFGDSGTVVIPNDIVEYIKACPDPWPGSAWFPQ